MRIAHISDLHVGREFDSASWDHICSVVGAAKPDVIVITGDLVDHPFPLPLLLAKIRLQRLLDKTTAKALVVPGNHDIALFGNIQLPGFKHLFHRVMGSSTETLIPVLEPLLEPGKPVKRFFCRVRARWRLIAWLLSKPGSCPIFDAMKYPLLKPIEIDAYRTLICGCLDSNVKGRFATGFIDDKAINELSLVTNEPPGSTDISGALTTRILLVHHHPLPIPSATDQGDTNLEGFLVLRNSGALVRQLCKGDWDLVLHGHKHYAGFSRLSLGIQDSDDHLLPVVATASASRKHSNPGRNGWNQIDISPSGRISITMHRFGGGDASTSEGPFFALHRAGHKRRSYRRCVKRQGVRCDRIERSIFISNWGTAESRLRYTGLQVVNGCARGLNFRFLVDKGRVVEMGIDERTAAEGHSYQAIDTQVAADDDRGLKEARAIRVALASPLLPTSSTPTDVGIQVLTANTYVLTRWESVARNWHRPERAGYRVKFPTKRLRLRLRVDDLLEGIRPRVEVYRPSNYPRLQLDDDRIVSEVDRSSFNWEIDQEETADEKENLRELASCEWELDVEYPLVGYRYTLCWDVVDAEHRAPRPSYVARTRRIWDLLLRHRDAANAGETRWASAFSAFLSAIRKDYDGDDQGEVFSLRLYTFDQAARVIRLVDAWSEDGSRDEQGWREEFGIGEGLPGVVFKQCRPLIYLPSELRLNPHAQVWMEDPTTPTQSRVVLGVPVCLEGVFDEWEAGARGPSCPEIAGVVCLSSNTEATNLMRFADLTQYEDAMDQFLWAVHEVFWRHLGELGWGRKP